MILICTRKCQILDRSIKPGQPVDVPEALLESDLVKTSFERPESVDAQKKAEAEAAQIADKSAMTAAQLKAKLDEWGVKYKGNASRESLQNIYNAQVASHPEIAPA